MTDYQVSQNLFLIPSNSNDKVQQSPQQLLTHIHNNQQQQNMFYSPYLKPFTLNQNGINKSQSQLNQINLDSQYMSPIYSQEYVYQNMQHMDLYSQNLALQNTQPIQKFSIDYSETNTPSFYPETSNIPKVEDELVKLEDTDEPVLPNLNKCYLQKRKITQIIKKEEEDDYELLDKQLQNYGIYKKLKQQEQQKGNKLQEKSQQIPMGIQEFNNYYYFQQQHYLNINQNEEGYQYYNKMEQFNQQQQEQLAYQLEQMQKEQQRKEQHRQIHQLISQNNNKKNNSLKDINKNNNKNEEKISQNQQKQSLNQQINENYLPSQQQVNQNQSQQQQQPYQQQIQLQQQQQQQKQFFIEQQLFSQNQQNQQLQQTIKQWVYQYKENQLVKILFCMSLQNNKSLLQQNFQKQNLDNNSQSNNNQNIFDEIKQLEDKQICNNIENIIPLWQNIFQLKNESDQTIKKLPKIYQPQPQQQQSNSENINTQNQDTSQKNTSKFHNRNKLFINGLIRFFTKENILKLQMPQLLSDLLFQVMDRARLSGRLLNDKKVLKTDLFNHSHYNLLFQKLNQNTCQYLKKSEKDVNLHKQIFDIDISQEDLFMSQESQEKIDLVNFLKQCIFFIVCIHLKNDIVQNTSEQDSREYEVRAFNGITQMIDGNIIQRF